MNIKVIHPSYTSPWYYKRHYNITAQWPIRIIDVFA